MMLILFCWYIFNQHLTVLKVLELKKTLLNQIFNPSIKYVLVHVQWLLQQHMQNFSSNNKKKYHIKFILFLYACSSLALPSKKILLVTEQNYEMHSAVSSRTCCYVPGSIKAGLLTSRKWSTEMSNQALAVWAQMNVRHMELQEGVVMPWL